MGNRQKLTPEEERMRDEWRSLSQREFSDEELAEFHIKLEKYNYLQTVKELERFYIDTHCAVRQYPPNKGIDYLQDRDNPGHALVERVNNKIEQWSAWRKRKFGSIREIKNLEKQALIHAVDPLASEFE